MPPARAWETSLGAIEVAIGDCLSALERYETTFRTAYAERGGPPESLRIHDPFDFGTFVLSGALARDRPDTARRLVQALDDAILRMRRDPAAARRAMGARLRPTERAFVERYPETAHRTSREIGAELLATEIAAETRMGIIGHPPQVRFFSPRGDP